MVATSFETTEAAAAAAAVPTPATAVGATEAAAVATVPTTTIVTGTEATAVATAPDTVTVYSETMALAMMATTVLADLIPEWVAAADARGVDLTGIWTAPAPPSPLTPPPPPPAPPSRQPSRRRRGRRCHPGSATTIVSPPSYEKASG